MNSVKKYPSASLSHLIRNYWMFEVFDYETPLTQLLFPYGSFEMIFYLKGNGVMKYTEDSESFIQEKCFFSGQFTRSFELKFTEPCKCIGVSFYPWAGKMLFNIPSNHFTNQMAPLDIIEKDSALFDQLSYSKNDYELFFNLENYLLIKLVNKKQDEIVQAAINKIIQRPDKNDLIQFLDDKAGLSRRRMQQRFLECAGLTMMHFIRKVRFQKSLHKLKYFSSTDNLTQIGLDSNYYDQAHFINEFKYFAGVSPSRFLKQNSDLKDFIQSLVIT